MADYCYLLMFFAYRASGKLVRPGAGRYGSGKEMVG